MTYTCDGFVDLQVNGYLGISFGSADLTEEDARKACDGILASGTAAFLITVTTNPIDRFERNLPLLCKLINDPAYKGRLLGFHLEGPFLNPKPGAIGAHNPDWCQPPKIEILEKFQEWAQGHVRLITVAADLPGVEDLCKHAVSMGICVSSGHTLAETDDLNRLAEAGGNALTHLGNGLPNEIHRHHNPIWSGLAHDDYTAMIITDGHHLPAELQKVMIEAKGVDKTVVVSDASSMAGMPPGRYQGMGNLIVLEENGLLHNPEKQCMVGSSAMMFQCMNQLAGLDLLSYEEMIQVSITNPLKLINASSDDYQSDLSISYDPQSKRFSLANS